MSAGAAKPELAYESRVPGALEAGEAIVWEAPSEPLPLYDDDDAGLNGCFASVGVAAASVEIPPCYFFCPPGPPAAAAGYCVCW